MLGGNKMLTLELLKENYCVCRLEAQDAIPEWCEQGDFYSMTKTKDELSIVCSQQYVPENIQAERNWRIFKILGPLDFSLIGILSKISLLMAECKISIFALSTYDTDYILVKDDKVDEAVRALVDAGYQVV